MRALTVTLVQNVASTVIGSQLDLTGKIADLAEISWEIDEMLTKVVPGDLTMKIWDEDGAVWAWLQANLTCTDPISTLPAMFPPFIQVAAAGVPVFLGIVTLDGISRDARTRIIQLSAQDWSVMLGDSQMSASEWGRKLPKIYTARTVGGPYAAFVGWSDFMGAGWLGGADVVFVTSDPAANIQAGDTVTTSVSGAAQFKVTSVMPTMGFGSPWWITLAGWNSETYFPGHPGTGNLTLSRLSGTIGTDQHYYTAQAAPSGLALKLDTVDWLVPGDTLVTPSGGTVQVSDVDAERLEVLSLDPITAQIAIGDKLTLSPEALNQVVYQDAGTILKQAALPYSLDLSRFSSPTLARPVMSLLPLVNASSATGGAGDDLRASSDIEATLTGLRVFGAGGVWDGTPEAGYAFTAFTPPAPPRMVDWTCQLTSAPARLMPDDSVALGDYRSRNRLYGEWRWNQPVYLSQTAGQGWQALATPAFAPSSNIWPAKAVVHDYNQFRRIVVTNGGAIGVTATYSEQRWSGSAWSTATTGNWPRAGQPCSIVPMPGVAATTGPVAPQGQALLALCAVAGGTGYELQLVWQAGTVFSLAVPATQAQGALLRITPWGAYLLGPGGYGKITFNGSALAMVWVPVYDQWYCTIQPSTFAAIDANSVWIMGWMTVSVQDGGTTKTVSQMWWLQLAATPVANVNPVLWTEKAMDGTPRIARAFRDPSNANRIIGLVGGRLIQIAAWIPRTVERFNPVGMTAAEIIEHVCQLLMAVAIPLPSGKLQVVTRVGSAGALSPVLLTVPQTEIIENRLTQHFFSVVRVTGAQDDLYFDASGSTLGGKSLEVESHPMVWTMGGCAAMAMSYAAFYGVLRREQSQSWFHENADTAPPWESLARLGPLKVNSDTTTWLLMGLRHNLIKGTAKATLLEAP